MWNCLLIPVHTWPLQNVQNCSAVQGPGLPAGGATGSRHLHTGADRRRSLRRVLEAVPLRAGGGARNHPEQVLGGLLVADGCTRRVAHPHGQDGGEHLQKFQINFFKLV